MGPRPHRPRPGARRRPPPGTPTRTAVGNEPPLEHGKARLLGVRLSAQSVGVGKRIGDLGLPREAAITAVVREEHVHQCPADFILRADDEVFVLLAGDDESAIQQVLVG